MTIYTVDRLPSGNVAAFVNEKPLRHIPLHSPDGFECGYEGSGPADLALAILADAFNASHDPDAYRLLIADDEGSPEARAWKLHQAFKTEFVAPSRDGFEISREQVLAWAERAAS